MSLKLGVDVGGTFTDVLLVSEETGKLTMAKVLSTPEDQSKGVMDWSSGVERTLAMVEASASDTRGASVNVPPTSTPSFRLICSRCVVRRARP